VKVYDAEHLAPYAVLYDQWVGYDDEFSLIEKIKYIKDNGYGGWMVWNMDLDDFDGLHCGAGAYPLIKMVNQALLGSLPSQSFTTVTTTKATTVPYTGPSTTPAPTTPPAGGSGFCAGKSNGEHANPETCSSFYTCSNGVGGLTNCGSNVYYDDVNRVCNWPAALTPERRAHCGV